MTIVFTIITLSILGILSAVILFVVAQKFKVQEDPRIDQVEAALPLANCGGCGYPGCRNFAEACVAAEELTDLYCPGRRTRLHGGRCPDSGERIVCQRPDDRGCPLPGDVRPASPGPASMTALRPAPLPRPFTAGIRDARMAASAWAIA